MLLGYKEYGAELAALLESMPDERTTELVQLREDNVCLKAELEELKRLVARASIEHEESLAAAEKMRERTI
jgi:hypothetical protein